MSATFNKLIVGANVLALLFLASAAQAAPSLGYPAGRPYYGANNQSSGSRTFRRYSPPYSTETRQSFSYEPAESGVTVKGSCGCRGHVAAPQAAAKKAETKQDIAAAPQVTRRSYSYEPATPAPQRRAYSRNSGPTKEPWQYQKTDPRRRGR
jgi:hypothetical protein